MTVYMHMLNTVNDKDSRDKVKKVTGSSEEKSSMYWVIRKVSIK